METEALLKPMPADALMRRPAQQASAQVQTVRFQQPQADPAALRAPVFAPKPEKAPSPADDLDALVTGFLTEEEDDDPVEDAVPTSRMPTPVCVPLYQDMPKRRRNLWWLAPVLLAVVSAGVYALWRYGLLPF